jgi:protein-L-isoaspartate O-methyltransferase
MKRTDPPPAEPATEAAPMPVAIEPVLPPVAFDPVERAPVPEVQPDLAAMRATLKAGVKVAVVPQLFPTPDLVAARMVELADIRPGHRVLEPSAGTGSLLRALPDEADALAVEINPSLCDALRHAFNPRDDAGKATGANVICDDFLECRSGMGTFDRIVMNPPFANGADIKHILHARTFLKPGGRLVAICADGPRQRQKLQPISWDWIPLPEGTFKDQGTDVRTAMIVIDAADAPAQVEATPPEPAKTPEGRTHLTVKFVQPTLF